MKNIFLMLVLTLTLGGFAFGECGDADKKALETLDRAWVDAIDNGDREALMGILADEYTGLPSMQNKMQNIEAVVAAAARNKANPQMADKSQHTIIMQ